MINLSELAKKLKNEKSVALFCHVRPDGDCLGSALALKNALKTLGVKAEVFCDDAVPSRFFFLNDTKSVKSELDANYDAFLAIDCADISRLGSFSEKFLSHSNTYVIDHHISNTRYAKINYVVELASNAENVLELIKELGAEITVDTANLLLMGIMTDTGNFRHKNVTPSTFYSAGKLLELGANVNEIYFQMFSAQSEQRAKLFGQTMSKIRYFLDGRFAVATVRLSDFEVTGAEQNETEGFIDFIMGIHGVEVGACVMETQKDKYKISFRSKTANVNAVAGTFGGGGHVLASGCQIQGDYEEVVDKIYLAVKRELPL
ncbi:MAG: bifunctional oligoribonuclease/PAP phosphatase NrnA [Clostridiales bacterium]|nr:bifunctional oligoribonuclease/PAP phosphatase NrnA [Clostridiales bacterium]